MDAMVKLNIPFWSGSCDSDTEVTELISLFFFF